MLSWPFTVVCVAALTLSVEATVDKRFPSNRNGDKLTNMVEKDGHLYVAENGLLHQLDLALNSIKSFNTCVGTNCDNINKVLTVYNDSIILCGTGNKGICQAWKDGTVTQSSASDSGEVNYLTVSTEENKPAVGLVHGGDFYFGVTYGQGIGMKTIGVVDTYTYFISKTHIDQSFSPLASVYLTDKDFPVYFKKVFQTNSFVYFLTNQKYELTSSEFVSKLIRICLDETYDNQNRIKSYTDIVLSCEVDGVDYNLLQDAEFLPAKGILVASFSQGDDPENPTSDSAVCVYTIDDVNDAIKRAKEDFFTCSTRNHTVGAPTYVDTSPPNCLSNAQYQTVKQDYICPTINPSSGSAVIGYIPPLQPNSTYKVENVVVTKVKGRDRYDMYPDIFLGTDKGSISKLTLDDSWNIHMYETNTVIDQGHAVTDIHIGEDKAYVVTNRKVSSFPNKKCSTFKTCQETIAGKNPSCGWCLAKNMSYTNTECSSGWISSLSECVSIDASPKYISVDDIASTEITITLKNVPDPVTTEMRCKYLEYRDEEQKLEQIGGLIEAIRSGDNAYKCNISSGYQHAELKLQLLAFDTTILFMYAETTIQIYDCQSYKKCGTCFPSPEVNCRWCAGSLTCQKPPFGSCSNPVTNKDSCTKLTTTTPDIYLPNGKAKEVTLNTQNLVTVPGVTYKCSVEQNGLKVEAPASIDSSLLKCSLNVVYDENSAKKVLPLTVYQSSGSNEVEIETSIEVTVYKCEHLAADCTQCTALKPSQYDCKWCGNDHDSQCSHTSECSGNVTCPRPQITNVDPPEGGYKGGTQLIITGTDFGTNPGDVTDVMVGDIACKPVEVKQTDNSDFEDVNKEVHCKIDTVKFSDDTSRIGTEEVTFKFKTYQVGNRTFSFQNPVVSKIEPSFGAAIGGTLITLSGSHLGIERGVPKISLGTIGSCTNVLSYNNILECTTPETKPTNISVIRLSWNQFYDSSVDFQFLPTPNITQVLTGKSILSGGTILVSKGTSLKSAAQVGIIAEYAGESETDTCEPSSSSSLSCSMPKAPPTAVNEMNQNNAGSARRRRKRSTNDDSISIQISIKMDGYEKTFSVDYYRDPVVESFKETTTVFKSGERRLTITGDYLNLVGGSDDYKVFIGLGDCLVIEVTRTNITCVPPQNSPNKTAEELEVVVQLGYFRQPVGYVRYEIVTVASLQNILVIVLPIVAGLLIIGLIAGTIGTCKYQRVKGRAKKFEKNLVDMEMKIKKVLREEFLDMHTTMSRVNENLIEKGFPYNNYQRYTFLMLFPGEWHMDEHPLMHEPVVSKRKVSDSVRHKLKKGMDTFEQLLLNKFFLVSVISTMEKQRKFFLKERSNMAGHLSVALLGRMDYFHEILTVLLTTLVDETPQKQQKTLFRRCESITEKLLSSWLVLSLYPHVKMHSGSPLYMLLKGTQLTMESGPIDAITGDSKYTLSEDKLLRQDDKHTTLTLKVLVENSDEIRECKVLDCDTVSQVKAKCLSQIYVNYPASQLVVDSSELNLEWHWGSGGRLVIKDEDNTSKREGDWLQLNTLEHYSVRDGSSMALVDPNGQIDQEDYVNLAHIKIDTDGCDGSTHSNEPLHIDVENGGPITRWHLVKSDEEKQSSGSVITDELYLNRLITTKQSVLEYMKNVFDTILNTTIPPPAKFLFDFLDEAGERNKVDNDALHAWKSQCYTIRFWATLINRPYNLFDQRIPSYVETSMEVISQVLIESCSLKGHQYTKDSSPGKLIFKNDMMTYRDKVKEYYNQVKNAQQTPEELRQYLTDLNKFQQQQTNYNRHSALYSLYTQLQPYMEEILEDLESDEDTRSLHLDKKLANLNDSMQEE